MTGNQEEEYQSMQLRWSLLAVILLQPVSVHSKSTIEACNGVDTCTSMVAYNLRTDLKLSEIATRFQVDPASLLGANAFDISVPDAENQIIPAQYVIRVPIDCQCVGGIRKSAPSIYRVKPGDNLFTIADTVFSRLVTPAQIKYANRLPDSGPVGPGQLLLIPLPCACFNGTDNGLPAVYLSYVVQAEDSLVSIAMEHVTTASDLKSVNSLGSQDIAPGGVLHVPLAACSSTTSKHWSDGNLLVANGSYAITASRCVQCSCGPRDLDLYCAPATLGTSCPSMQCENSNLTIGNFTTQKTSAGCSVTTCSYSGYKNGKILTSLSSSVQSECPVKHVLPSLTRPSSTTLPPPPPGISTPGKAPSPGSPGAIGTAPASGPSGHKSAAAGSLTLLSGSLRWFSLPIMLISGLPFLIHFGDW